MLNIIKLFVDWGHPQPCQVQIGSGMGRRLYPAPAKDKKTKARQGIVEVITLTQEHEDNFIYAGARDV